MVDDPLMTHEGQSHFCRRLVMAGAAREYGTIQREGLSGKCWVADVPGFRVYFDSIHNKLWPGSFRSRPNDST